MRKSANRPIGVLFLFFILGKLLILVCQGWRNFIHIASDYLGKNGEGGTDYFDVKGGIWEALIRLLTHQNQNGYYKDVFVGSQMFNMTYGFDGAGNVTDRTNNLTDYINNYTYDDVHNLTSATVEGAFVQERAGTSLLAEGDFKGQRNLVQVSNELYEVAFDFNANSVGMSFATEIPIAKVELKHFDDMVSTLTHRFTKKSLSVYKSADNVIFTEVERNKWEFSRDVYGNVVIDFTDPVTTRYIKVHSRFEDRDDDYQIIDNADYKNYLSDMVHVYQLSAEGTMGYSYDLVGNRTEKSRTTDSGTETINYHYDAGVLNGNGRRLLYETVVGADDVERNLYGYSYDANGNLIEKSTHFIVNSDETVNLITTGDGVEYWQYGYDVQNRLVKIKKGNEEVASYAYDVSGNRIFSEVAGQRTNYVYNFQGTVLFEEDEGAEIRSYIYLNGKKIIEVKGNTGENDEIYYYHQDHLGSTSLVTNQIGQVVSNQDYLPFGDDLNRPGIIQTEGSYQSRYKYTGQYHQHEVDLYYYGARFYDPRLGRFITEDTYLGEATRPKTQHLYQYVLNNRVPRLRHS